MSLLLFFFVYQYGGLRYYVRANWFIAKMSSQNVKIRAWSDFYGDKEVNLFGGIYIGNVFNRIFIWGIGGLLVFTVDQWSVFRYSDACTLEIASKISAGAGKQNEIIIFDFNDWITKVKQGDFIVVLTAGKNNGGVYGNLRQAYTFNYWPFIQNDIQTQCKK